MSGTHLVVYLANANRRSLRRHTDILDDKNDILARALKLLNVHALPQ